jgi:predicted HTH domain antitoxin
MSDPDKVILRKLDELKVSNEMTRAIQKFVDVVSEEDMSIQLEIKRANQEPDSLNKMAKLAELKIRANQINRIRKKVRKILSDLVNILVIASIDVPKN